MWYGLKIDGEIRYVNWFNKRPTIFDFRCSWSSDMQMEVVPVQVAELY